MRTLRRLTALHRPAALLLVVVLAVVAGCATVADQTGPDTVRAAPFELMGRVLVNHDGRAFSANMRWAHAADSDELWLLTPTGQGLAELRSDAAGAVLTGADHSSYRGRRVESLTKQGLGWELPLTRLQYWVRGEPAPGEPHEIVERDTGGKARVLSQGGWRVTYEYYPAETNNGLPRRIELTGPAQNLRLVVDTWGRAKADAE